LGQLSNYISSAVLKHYFNVTTGYVARKLLLVLFPWRHRPWSRQQRPSSGAQDAGYYFLPPREDINSPDMYIPVMALVSYILLSALLAGLRGAFHPEVMGSTLSWAFVVVVCELLALKGGTYLLGINNESQLLDLVAYSGYKFVGVIVTLLVAEIVNLGRGPGGWAGWIAFIYTFNANAFFLVSCALHVPLRLLACTKADLCFLLAALAEIRAPSRRLVQRDGTAAEDVPDVLSIWLLICGAVGLHVAPDSTGNSQYRKSIDDIYLNEAIDVTLTVEFLSVTVYQK